MACTVYQILNARNRKTFEDEPVNVETIIRKIKTHVYKLLFSTWLESLEQMNQELEPIPGRGEMEIERKELDVGKEQTVFLSRHTTI